MLRCGGSAQVHQACKSLPCHSSHAHLCVRPAYTHAHTHTHTYTLRSSSCARGHYWRPLIDLTSRLLCGCGFGCVPSVTKTVPRFGFLSLDLKKSSFLSASLGAKGFRDSPTLTNQYIGRFKQLPGRAFPCPLYPPLPPPLPSLPLPSLPSPPFPYLPLPTLPTPSTSCSWQRAPSFRSVFSLWKEIHQPPHNFPTPPPPRPVRTWCIGSHCAARGPGDGGQCRSAALSLFCHPVGRPACNQRRGRPCGGDTGECMCMFNWVPTGGAGWGGLGRPHTLP